MYRIEKEMLENFYSSKKPLQKGKNIIISDINNKIFSIVNNLEKECSIPKSIFFTYFNLHIPQLELSDIYKWINRNTSITELKNLKLQYSNVENIHQLWSSIHFWKNCNLLFIWEAPAKDGWRTTWKAWINEKWNIIPSGKILQQLLEYLNINLMDITFTEAVKCFPKDRKELLSMGKLWQKILYEQIDFLSPNIIITLWDFPTKALLWNTYKKFTDVVWKEFFIEIKNQKYIIIPTYHPSPISPQSLKGNIDIYKKINKLLNT